MGANPKTRRPLDSKLPVHLVLRARRIALFMHATLSLKESFWLYRPFTRIVRSWHKAYRDVKAYVYLNQLEAEGLINRNDTKALQELRAIWDDF